jgi:protein-S-isoprenylcysteine O-methyltransferase Ste14
MKASNWEFTNRAMVFGLIYGVAFPLYGLDHQNASGALASWLAPRIHWDADSLARLLLFAGAGLAAVAALIRTWASAYLQADVVYASEVKTEAVVADGPYRRVRNPLYFANVVLAFGMGAMMSRAGFVFSLVATWVFCYRLILREEAELLASQGEAYDRYRKAVPRLLPSPWPRIPSAGQPPRWGNGFRAELWSWGFAASVLGFAITLKLLVFFAILGASLAVFWLGAAALQKKGKAQSPDGQKL